MLQKSKGGVHGSMLKKILTGNITALQHLSFISNIAMDLGWGGEMCIVLRFIHVYLYYTYLLGSLHSSHSQLNVNYLSVGGISTVYLL